ncbi:hypothetical protein EDB85DRAFT_1900985 [Lactarius pseudohatsudake]|nr:hypothetical protein EDB85DRAFT_1900985 [Lactarius pseudohatsudake]
MNEFHDLWTSGQASGLMLGLCATLRLLHYAWISTLRMDFHTTHGLICNQVKVEKQGFGGTAPNKLKQPVPCNGEVAVAAVPVWRVESGGGGTVSKRRRGVGRANDGGGVGASTWGRAVAAVSKRRRWGRVGSGRGGVEVNGWVVMVQGVEVAVGSCRDGAGRGGVWVNGVGGNGGAGVEVVVGVVSRRRRCSRVELRKR